MVYYTRHTTVSTLSTHTISSCVIILSFYRSYKTSRFHLEYRIERKKNEKKIKREKKKPRKKPHYMKTILLLPCLAIDFNIKPET